MDGFLRKSNSDKVYMEFWEVDFLVANTQFTNLRFVLVSRDDDDVQTSELKDGCGSTSQTGNQDL